MDTENKKPETTRNFAITLYPSRVEKFDKIVGERRRSLDIREYLEWKINNPKIELDNINER